MSGLSSGGLTADVSQVDASAILKLLADPVALKASIEEYGRVKAEAEAAVALVCKVKDIEKQRVRGQRGV